MQFTLCCFAHGRHTRVHSAVLFWFFPLTHPHPHSHTHTRTLSHTLTHMHTLTHTHTSHTHTQGCSVTDRPTQGNSRSSLCCWHKVHPLCILSGQTRRENNETEGNQSLSLFFVLTTVSSIKVVEQDLEENLVLSYCDAALSLNFIMKTENIKSTS
eukprot:TRINITY_DN37479_c0_g1_i3.p1 TRINITY_DN37479_c0_g1~~TRINITY_DN37479_c0_g1_i3.p1  ORF type:complete len:156 (+),score=19.57 TRINITY_DN37479_c0_g1_i3:1049-1516(+)